MKYTNILWDYNGTILDDVNAGLLSANMLLGNRGMRRLPDIEAYKKIFGFPIIDYYKRLGFDFGKEPYESIASEWVEHYDRFFKDAKLHSGVREILGRLRDAGIRQVIVSATRQDILRGYVESCGISEFFDEVIGISDIYAYSKEHEAREYISRAKPERALFFGDTVHDFEVASALGIDCVLITKGHQTRETLERCGCPVIDDYDELMTLVL